MPAGQQHNMTVQELAKMGGLARAAKQTPEERKALAQKAAAARWKGHKKKGKK